MALVFFLIAAIIGGIVITAASASAGRLTHLRDEQQAYLTVSSAARLARDEINGIRCTIENISESPGGPLPTTYKILPENGALSPYILGVSMFFFSGAYSTETFTIIPDAGSETAAVTASVTGITTVTSGTNYLLVITLTSEDTETPYKMVLSVPFSIAEDEIINHVNDPNGDGDSSDSYTTTTTTTIYSFGLGTIEKGD